MANNAGGLAGLKSALMEGPVCKIGEFSRPNHLGNGQAPSSPGVADVEAGYAAATNTFAFEIPTFSKLVHTQYDAKGTNNAAALACVIRLRYNMSTTDFPRDTINAALNQGNDGATSPITQDPYVEIGNAGAGDIGTVKANGNPTQLLALNMNTNQLARTFQDRSYVFKVRAIPETEVAALAANCEPVAGKAEIWNVNVQGKRGNIVQTYPSVEYNWVPQSICAPQKACLHFQATGSDYNPRRGCNDGPGGPPDPDNNQQSNQNARADRSNLVEQTNFDESYPMVTPKTTGQTAKLAFGTAGVKKGSGNQRPFFDDAETAYRFAFLDQEAQLQGKVITDRFDNMWTGATYHYARNSARQDCLSETEINNLQAGNRRETHPRNCAFLNAARTPYQNQGLVKITEAHPVGDKYALYSTRNNNFSNREQQLAIQVGSMASGQLKCSNDAQGGATTATVIPGIINLQPVVEQTEYEATIARMAELDVDGDDPVENDGTGDGIKVGCTSLIMNAASCSGISFISVLLVFSTILLR
jgi:hypothetical protein